MSRKLLYASFDVVPAPKGASVHIEQFCAALAKKFGSLLLVTVEMSSLQQDRGSVDRPLAKGSSLSIPELEHVQLPAIGANLLDRVNYFRRSLELWWGNRYVDVAHFRSPFEGLWIAQQKGRRVGSIIFEVNGLPSIELKYRYPRVAEDSVFLEKLIRQEDICLSAADLVITPSQITAEFLQGRGVEKSKIKVIPNGVDLNLFTFDEPRSLDCDGASRLLYFGTLSAWQGVEQAVSVLTAASAQRNLELTVLGSAKVQQIENLKALAAKLNVTDRLRIVPACTQKELVQHLHSSHIVLAPLSANDRNLRQGCCPFKIIESMAAGRPVLSTALPVVQEIAGVEGCIYTAKAGSAASMRESLESMLASPAQTLQSARQARRRIEANYDLERTTRSLTESYEELLSNLAVNSAK